MLEAIGLADLVDATRAAGLRDVSELDSDGVQQVRVAEPIPADELDRLDSVLWWENLDESPSGVTYLWEVDADCGDCAVGEHSTAYEIADIDERGSPSRSSGHRAISSGASPG